jgi:hypothetical protein
MGKPVADISAARSKTELAAIDEALDQTINDKVATLVREGGEAFAECLRDHPL